MKLTERKREKTNIFTVEIDIFRSRRAWKISLNRRFVKQTWIAAAKVSRRSIGTHSFLANILDIRITCEERFFFTPDSHPRGVCAFERQASPVTGPHASSNFRRICYDEHQTRASILPTRSSTSCHSSREWRQKHSRHQEAITLERSRSFSLSLSLSLSLPRTGFREPRYDSLE